MISSNLANLQHSEQHQTPIKKGKEMLLVQPRTAESEQESVVTLQSIDAQQLFQQFSKIVKITEDEQADFDDEISVQRKLNYESPVNKLKLNFSPSNSSMKKRERICYKSQTEHKFQGMILFHADEKENQRPKESIQKKIQNEESQIYLSPLPRERELKQLGSWATRKKVDSSD